MKTRSNIITKLEQLKDDIIKQYKIKEIGVFGSIIRGEQKETSDVDILVDFEKGADLFDLVGLALFLEEKLGRKVDVVSKRALRKEIKGVVLKEVAYL